MTEEEEEVREKKREREKNREIEDGGGRGRIGRDNGGPRLAVPASTLVVPSSITQRSHRVGMGRRGQELEGGTSRGSLSCMAIATAMVTDHKRINNSSRTVLP